MEDKDRMHVCLGVCGIGRGHSSRQYQLARHLLSRGYTITVVGYGEALNYFKSQGIHIEKVWVPFIAELENGLSIRGALKDNYKKMVPGLLRNLFVFIKLLLKGYPDVFISDYEPVVAQFAYLRKRQLIILGQQSKFRHWDFPPIGSYNTKAEKRRLELFFPYFNKSFVVSFHGLPNVNDPRIKVIPPFIPSEIQEVVRGLSNNIVVYFSKLGEQGIPQSLVEFCDIIKDFKEYCFIIYTNDDQETVHPNIRFKRIHRNEFIDDMGQSCAVISTAGFTLISEAIFLQKPLFCIPLPTYDQNFCAQYINNAKIGIGANSFSRENLRMFLTNLPRYTESIEQQSFFFGKVDPLSVVSDFLDKKCSEKKRKRS